MKFNFALGILVSAISLSAHALINVESVATGGRHTCAVMNDGAVKCWGQNTFGQLGDGTKKTRSVPTSVLGLPSPAISVSAGNFETCALLRNGEVWCWGLWVGQLVPTKIGGLNLPVRSIALGSRGSCVLLSDGSMRCWGAEGGASGFFGNGNEGGAIVPEAPQFPVGTPKVQKIFVGGYTVCAILQDGTLWCWGDNSYSLAGNSNGGDVYFPAKVDLFPQRVRDVAIGKFHACATLEDNSLWCWGRNRSCELGTGNCAAQARPVVVPLLAKGVQSVSAIEESTCVVLVGGSIACWGANGYGQLGLGIADFQTSGVPEFLGNAQPAKSIGPGTPSFHACGIFSNGLLKCWGRNTYGQLGYGDFLDRGTTETIDDIEFIDVSR